MIISLVNQLENVYSHTSLNLFHENIEFNVFSNVGDTMLTTYNTEIHNRQSRLLIRDKDNMQYNK